MKALLFFLLINVIPVTTGKSYIDPRVERYVEDYFELLEKNGITPPVQFSIQIILSKKHMRYNAVGMAYGMFTDNVVMIALDPEILNLDVNQIRWTIYHELTHDIFDIRHESGLFLMTPVLPPFVTQYDLEASVCQLADYLSGR